MTAVHILEEPFCEREALEAFRRECDDVGAVASFVGYCRAREGNSDVVALELAHYPLFTARVIESYAHNLAGRERSLHTLVIHRVGLIPPRDAIVLVAAGGRHRAAALQFVTHMMDWLKTDAPIWKREHTSDGARWIEPTSEDRVRRSQFV